MTKPLIADLNRQFGISGVAEIVSGSGGLPKVRVTTSLCTGEVYLHGAHVTSWIPAGEQEVIFVSKESKFEDGKAIRGGVPICFPWFGPKADDPAAPAHGFVRAKSWNLKQIHEQNGNVTVSLETSADESTRRWWPFDFRITHDVTFGAELKLELLVENPGDASLSFAEALHTYYCVGDVRRAAVRGLEDKNYIDKTRAGEIKVQSGPIVITEETDRVYLDTDGKATIDDPVTGRHMDVESGNSRTTVVWNPWVNKAKSFNDFGDDEWREMVCVETCNVADYSVKVASGERHLMSFRASVSQQP
jgi:glucose-6-phosphate 1-epimerase